jgi:hypothetical protein
MINGVLEMSDLVLFSGGSSSTIVTYTHIQSSVAGTWNIAHNLATTNLLVTVYDSTNAIITANVTVIDSANITVTVNPACAGKCVIMGV